MPIFLKFKAALDDSAFMAGIRRIRTASGKLGRGVVGAGGRAGRGIGGFLGGATGVTGLSLLGTAAGAGLASKKLIDQADAMDRLSAKTGITVEQLARLQGMAATTDVSLESMSTAIVRMQNNLEKGTANKALEDIGLSLRDLEGLAPDEKFLKIGKAINETGDDAKRTAAAMSVFGRGGADLFELFRDMETVDAEAVNKNAKAIAEGAKVLAPLADKISQGKFAIMAKGMQGLGATVAGAKKLMGIQDEEVRPEMLITTPRWRDTLGVGRKEEGLNTGRQGFGRLAPSAGLGTFGTAEGMGFSGGVHSVVRRGDHRRATAEQNALRKGIKDMQEEKEWRAKLLKAVEDAGQILEDNFDE